MRIESVKIQNLRSFRDQTITLNDYTCLIGPNGSGKSTVLCALNVFFRNVEGASINPSCLEKEDFHLKDTSEPARITVTFCDLSPEAQDDLKDYYRHGKLIVCAEAKWSDDQKGPVIQYGHRLVMRAFTSFFDKLNAKPSARADELKQLYRELRDEYPTLPLATSKADMESALRAYEAEHIELCEEVPSDDQFYGFSKGVNRLSKYIQWVYIPAVKDTSEEQIEGKSTALGKLLARTVRARISFADGISVIRQEAQAAYEKLLRAEQGSLEDLSAALRSRIGEWAHPDAKLRLEWRHDLDKSVKVEEPLAQIIAGEGSFEGDLQRFGHGFQRSILLALLQELSSLRDETSPKLILGIEEPELYQHPPQAKHLANVLHKLSTDNAQIVVCTHSPYFVSGQCFSDVRLIRKCHKSGASSASHALVSTVEQTYLEATGNTKSLPSNDGITARIHQTLQPGLNEMFFTPVLILVEGLEDIAHISSYMHLTGRWDEFRRVGCHFVAANGKEHILRPLAIAKHLGIRTFVVCDSDSDSFGAEPNPELDENKRANYLSRAKQHSMENIAIQKLAGRLTPSGFLSSDLWEPNLVMWYSCIGTTVHNDFAPGIYQEAFQIVQKTYGYPKGMDKNSLSIASCHAVLWEKGHRSNTLDRLCSRILDFGKAT